MASTSIVKSFFTFEPSDIRLKVNYKGDPVTAHVSSSAMSFASPVWKKFIFPPWKPMAVQDPTTTYESTPAAKKSKVTDKKEKDKSVLPVEEVDFSDDNGEALLILLRIAHLRFHDTPTTLPYETLLQVAVLCDQYQCINLVRPWLPQWLADEKKSSRKFGQENWMFIAWVFGREKVYEALARDLVLHLKPIYNSVYRISRWLTDMCKINDPMPPGTVDQLLEIRKLMINDRLERVLATVDECLETRELMCASDALNARADDCEAMVLGSFLRELQKLGVLPRSKNQENFESVSVFEFDQNLMSMDIKDVHRQCKEVLFEWINLAEASIPDPVPDAHRRHMKAQKEGLGLE